MDRELLDLIADYIEARALRREWPERLWDPTRDPDEIASRIATYSRPDPKVPNE